DSRTDRSSYALSLGSPVAEQIDWNASYVFTEIDSRTRTNFYFDPSPTPVATLVGFRGETHSFGGHLAWQPGPRLSLTADAAWTRVSGDFAVELHHLSLDGRLALNPRGSLG